MEALLLSYLLPPTATGSMMWCPGNWAILRKQPNHQTSSQSSCVGISTGNQKDALSPVPSSKGGISATPGMQASIKLCHELTEVSCVLPCHPVLPRVRTTEQQPRRQRFVHMSDESFVNKLRTERMPMFQSCSSASQGVPPKHSNTSKGDSAEQPSTTAFAFL